MAPDSPLFGTDLTGWPVISGARREFRGGSIACSSGSMPPVPFELDEISEQRTIAVGRGIREQHHLCKTYRSMSEDDEGVARVRLTRWHNRSCGSPLVIMLSLQVHRSLARTARRRTYGVGSLLLFVPGGSRSGLESDVMYDWLVEITSVAPGLSSRMRSTTRVQPSLQAGIW